MTGKADNKELIEVLREIAKDYDSISKTMQEVNTRLESILGLTETIHKVLLERKSENPSSGSKSSELEDKISEINDKITHVIEQIGKLKKMVYYHRRITEGRSRGYRRYSERYTRGYHKSSSGDRSDGGKSKR